MLVSQYEAQTMQLRKGLFAPTGWSGLQSAYPFYIFNLRVFTYRLAINTLFFKVSYFVFTQCLNMKTEDSKFQKERIYKEGQVLL